MSSNDNTIHVTQAITLDCTIPQMLYVRCAAHDKNSRYIEITVTNNGTPLFLDAQTMTVNYKIQKPDNNIIYNAASIVDGKAVIALTEQATTVIGTCQAELQLMEKNTDKVLSTMPFHILVEKSVLENEPIISAYESDVVNNLLMHAEKFNNPHQVTKAQLGLENVDNTSDSEKPISALQQSALDLKADISYVENAFTNLDNKMSSVSAGSSIKPVYFSSGKPVACTYTLRSNVPSNAVFTDTIYTHPTSSGYKHIPSGGSSGQVLSWSSDGTAQWIDPSGFSASGWTPLIKGKFSFPSSTSSQEFIIPSRFIHTVSSVNDWTYTYGCEYTNLSGDGAYVLLRIIGYDSTGGFVLYGLVTNELTYGRYGCSYGGCGYSYYSCGCSYSASDLTLTTPDNNSITITLNGIYDTCCSLAYCSFSVKASTSNIIFYEIAAI